MKRGEQILYIFSAVKKSPFIIKIQLVRIWYLLAEEEMHEKSRKRVGNIGVQKDPCISTYCNHISGHQTASFYTWEHILFFILLSWTFLIFRSRSTHCFPKFWHWDSLLSTRTLACSSTPSSLHLCTKLSKRTKKMYWKLFNELSYIRIFFDRLTLFLSKLQSTERKY